MPGVQVFQVLISGREPSVVDLIGASIRPYEKSDPEVASILGSIAALPYDGATPEEAKAWVESTITVLRDDPAEAQENAFGGVKFVLSGTPTALTLEMGELP